MNAEVNVIAVKIVAGKFADHPANLKYGKKLVLLGMMIGSAIGGYIPILFGINSFSFTAVISTFFGGLLGVWLSFRYLN